MVKLRRAGAGGRGQPRQQAGSTPHAPPSLKQVNFISVVSIFLVRHYTYIELRRGGSASQDLAV